MTATRILDDHVELASIGTNTHPQIDTHIAAADNYVKRNGSLALTSDWDIGDTRKIHADEIRARDAAGLKLHDDGGNGIFVKDGGNIGVKQANPGADLHIGSVLASYHSLDIPLYVVRSTGLGTLKGVMFLRRDDTPSNSGTIGYLAAFGRANSNVAAWYMGVDTNQNAVLVSNNTSMRLGSDFCGTFYDGIYMAWNYSSKNHKIGIRTTLPTAVLDLNSNVLRLRTAKTPATAGAAGNTGDICWDASYIYVCTATNSWERAAIAAW